MNIIIEKNIKENPKLRESFIALAVETFDLSFEKWYQNGYWTDAYIPYSIVDNGNVIANASVNIIDTLWENHPRRYLVFISQPNQQNQTIRLCILCFVVRHLKSVSA